MGTRPVAATKATVFTAQLAGPALAELLDATEGDYWPNDTCEAEWALLRNWAMQTETLMVDEAENLAWSRRCANSLDATSRTQSGSRRERRRSRPARAPGSSPRPTSGTSTGTADAGVWGLLRTAVREQYRRWSAGDEDG